MPFFRASTTIVLASVRTGMLGSASRKTLIFFMRKHLTTCEHDAPKESLQVNELPIECNVQQPGLRDMFL